MFTAYSKKMALGKSCETDFDVHIKTRCSFDHNNFIAERFSQFCGNWAGFYCDEVAIFASTATLELVPHTKWTPRLLLLYDKSSPPPSFMAIFFVIVNFLIFENDRSGRISPGGKPALETT